MPLGGAGALFYIVDPVGLLLGGSSDIVWTEVERPDDVEGNFAVEAEALKANGGNLVTVLVEGANLSRRARLGTEDEAEGLTDSLYGLGGHSEKKRAKWVA